MNKSQIKGSTSARSPDFSQQGTGEGHQSNLHYLFEKVTQIFTFTFTFMHLADAFIQSDLHCIQVTVFTFYQLLLSLGIEPMILALLVPCSTS